MRYIIEENTASERAREAMRKLVKLGFSTVAVRRLQKKREIAGASAVDRVTYYCTLESHRGWESILVMCT